MKGYLNSYIESKLRNDETIISSISVTDIFFDVYLGKWNYRAIPKVKTWSYFLTISKWKLDDRIIWKKDRKFRQLLKMTPGILKLYHRQGVSKFV